MAVTNVAEQSKFDHTPSGIPVQVRLYILAVMGFMVNYMLRTDINLAMVSMSKNNETYIHPHDIFGGKHKLTVNKTTAITKPSVIDECTENVLHETHVIGPCRTLPNSKYPPEFNWTSLQEGNIQSSFYISYFISSGISGLFLNDIGPARLMGAAQLLAAAVGLLIPLVANENCIYVVVVRGVQGWLLGLTWPSYVALLTRWSAPHERSRFMSATQGIQLGAGVAYIIMGHLSAYFGWRSLFYFTGTVGIIWSLFWLMEVYEDPRDHPTISRKELEFITSRTAPRLETRSPPWIAILTSPVVFSIAIVNFGRMWILTLLHMYGPAYLKYVTKIEMTETGVLSGIPFIISYIAGFGAGWCADSMDKHKVMSTLNVRRFFTAVAQIIPGICMLLINFTDSAFQFTILQTISLAAQTLSTGGSLVSIVSIAPNFSGAVFGVVQCLFMIACIIVPFFQSYAVTDHHKLEQWRFLFNASGILSLVTYIPYHLFATEEVQPWNEIRPKRRRRTASHRVDSTSIADDVSFIGV
jgi:sugar phosphate permease